MKVKLFIDWVGNRVMSLAEGEAELALHINDKDNYEDFRYSYLNDIIEEWLKNHPTVHHSEFYRKLFDLTEAERAEIEAKCRENYEACVTEDFFSDWEEVEVEV
jgi:hypothetical protein